MASSRSQRVFQPDDAELARKLPKYDFPLCMVNCTPVTFLFMNTNVAVVYGEESIQTSDQQTVVITKPKYFVGSSGTVWASHLIDIKHKEPSLYEAEHAEDWQSKAFRSMLVNIKDTLRYLFYQLDGDNLMLVTDEKDCKFKENEQG